MGGMRSRLASLSKENRGHSGEKEQQAPHDRQAIEVSSLGSNTKMVI
jgi:hypothetical protein